MLLTEQRVIRGSTFGTASKSEFCLVWIQQKADKIPILCVEHANLLNNISGRDNCMCILVCLNISREYRTENYSSDGYSDEHAVHEVSSQITLFNGQREKRVGHSRPYCPRNAH